jgi:hypothetical protein
MIIILKLYSFINLSSVKSISVASIFFSLFSLHVPGREVSQREMQGLKFGLYITSL